jgi:hypothetical protein
MIGDADILYRGRLRFDALLSKRVVLPDAQVLDGTFFLTKSPDDLDGIIGRSKNERAPVEIRARATTLESSLVGLVKRAGSETLVGFEFSSLSDEVDRRVVQDKLVKTRSERLKSWRDLARIFVAAGVDKAKADELSSSWKRWVGTGDIPVLPWPGQSEFNFNQHVIGELAHSQAVAAYLESEGGAVVVARTITERVTVRSQFMNLLSECGASPTDRIILEAWYSRAYNATQAAQHGCDNYDMLDAGVATEPRISRRLGSALRAPFGRNRLAMRATQRQAAEVPSNFIYSLGLMDIDDYRFLLNHGDKSGRGGNRANFEKWWSEADEDSLKRGLDPFINEVTIQGLPSWAGALTSTSGRTAGVAVGAGVGAAVGLLPGALLGAFFGGTLGYMGERLLVAKAGPRTRLSRRVVQVARERRGHGQED